jgi:hypothetical protein
VIAQILYSQSNNTRRSISKNEPIKPVLEKNKNTRKQHRISYEESRLLPKPIDSSSFFNETEACLTILPIIKKAEWHKKGRTTKSPLAKKILLEQTGFDEKDGDKRFFELLNKTEQKKLKTSSKQFYKKQMNITAHCPSTKLQKNSLKY